MVVVGAGGGWRWVVVRKKASTRVSTDNILSAHVLLLMSCWCYSTTQNESENGLFLLCVLLLCLDLLVRNGVDGASRLALRSCSRRNFSKSATDGSISKT